MSEIYSGPVKKWEWDKKAEISISDMLESDDPLERAYGLANKRNCYVIEFAGKNATNSEAGMTAVGDMDTILELEYRHNTEIYVDNFTLAECVGFGAYPGMGETRAERVLDGIRQVMEGRSEIAVPDEMCTFGYYSDRGYFVKTMFAKYPWQDPQWTIRIFTDAGREFVREDTLPMVHEPAFGIDSADIAALDVRVAEILDELT